jgi:hypothetical protein
MGIGEGCDEEPDGMIVFIPVQRIRTTWKVASVGGGEEILSADPIPFP